MKSERIKAIRFPISIPVIFLFFLISFSCDTGNSGHKSHHKNIGYPSVKIIVDDYEGTTTATKAWYYSRIGTDRGEMGSGTYTVGLGNGRASVNVNSGWAGVWTSLMHRAIDNEYLNPKSLLGDYINENHQLLITGIDIKVLDGTGVFKVELKDLNRNLVFSRSTRLSGGEEYFHFSVNTTASLKELNWLISGPGNVIVDKVILNASPNRYDLRTKVFLYSYGHFCQCYDPATGFVRDRARWPAQDISAVQCMGTFALATAVAYDLGFVDEATARVTIEKIKDAILNLPLYNGLLPHFITDGDITVNSEWSSVDTVITLISSILACQALGIDSSGLEAMINQIDWAGLTNNHNNSISHGYDYGGNKLASSWDTFGAEAFILSVAYASATGNIAKLDNNSQPPTWDGSGFNDELAALFFPMTGIDVYGNDWNLYRNQAFNSQYEYFAGHRYNNYGLFGLSASEVPNPWEMSVEYGAWGVGGHNGETKDGSTTVGYPIIAPHYAAMVWSEHPIEASKVFLYLMKHSAFSPLNNVESFGMDDQEILHWNSLKGSWNLSLQVLGMGRAISDDSYLPYKKLDENAFLKQGFEIMMSPSP